MKVPLWTWVLVSLSFVVMCLISASYESQAKYWRDQYDEVTKKPQPPFLLQTNTGEPWESCTYFVSAIDHHDHQMTIAASGNKDYSRELKTLEKTATKELLFNGQCVKVLTNGRAVRLLFSGTLKHFAQENIE